MAHVNIKDDQQFRGVKVQKKVVEVIMGLQLPVRG